MTEHPIVITRCAGNDLAEILPELAALRVRVFRAWPYLYDGSQSYEAAYLQTYLRSATAAVIVARQDGRVVGASTCLALREETANVQAPFLQRGWDINDVFYFGESVLLPELRGRGVGVAFFAEREAHARAAGSRTTCFCSVIRPPDHRLRPAAYQPLDRFWSRRGYTRRPDLTCEMTWTDLGNSAATAKKLVFWLKSLDGSALP